MGKAVVSTTVGAEGLPVSNGEHVLLADEPHDVRPRGRPPAPRCRSAPRARSGGADARRRALRLVGGRRRARGRVDPLRTCRPKPAAAPEAATQSARADDDGCLRLPQGEDHEGLSLRSRICRQRVGRVVRRRRSRRRRRRRQPRQGRGGQRRPQPHRRARASTTCCARGVAEGRLRATTDTADAIQRREVSLLCVGTPSRKNGSLDLTYLERVCRADRRGAARQAGYHVVVVRSTVLPGTTHDVVIPALERESGKKYGDGFGVSVNPEFLREGTALKDFRKPPLTLVGHNHAADASGTIALYQAIDAPLISTSIRVAEMMKYTSNTWHALKVVLRERDRQPLQAARHRQPRGDGHLLPRREAEPLAVLPEAGLRVRRLVPAERRARAAVPRQGSRRRAAGDLVRFCRATGCRFSRRSIRCSTPARSASACSDSASRPAPTISARARSSSSPRRCSARACRCRIYDRNVSLAGSSARTRSTSRSRSRTCRRCSATRSTRSSTDPK